MNKIGKDGKIQGEPRFDQTEKSKTKTGGFGGTQTIQRNVVKNEADQYVFKPPKLEKLERKLQILSGEMNVESSFNSEDVAALYQYLKPMHGPFLIVPSISVQSLFNDPDQMKKIYSQLPYEFTLTIYSSKQCEIQRLDDSKDAVITG